MYSSTSSTVVIVAAAFAPQQNIAMEYKRQYAHWPNSECPQYSPSHSMEALLPKLLSYEKPHVRFALRIGDLIDPDEPSLKKSDVCGVQAYRFH